MVTDTTPRTVPGVPLARNTDCDRVTKEEDPNSQEWLLSLTDHLDVMGPSKFRLLEGWMDFNEQEFSLVMTDTLAAAGINMANLPEGWTTVVQKKRKKKVPTLPNVLQLFVGDTTMAK